ncbi:MAG: B12-binding domain-containing radical SAM protein [Thermoplasmatales archaeon]|nr:MAG: B12-binding domain-containing radical SAM protein [Thermoplasmatales archaeon]
MKILLVDPNYALGKGILDRFKLRLFGTPYITLQQLATITPEKHSIEILDETFEKIDFNKKYDLVGITSCTPSAPRAYEIADRFRNEGVIVVLGGYHPSGLPMEAKLHADSVVIGEAENSWPILLKDLENNKLREFYHSKKPADLSILKPIRRDIGESNFASARIEATRGCPIRCEFCSISNSRIGWHVFRKKPVENVIRELELIPQRFIAFCDTSLTIDVEYSISLFKEMKHLNKRFICYGNSNILNRNERLLKYANEAGCTLWNIGFDSFSQEALDNSGKRINIVKEYASVVKKIHDHGMAVLAQIIFGFDAETKDIFDFTIETVKQVKIDIPSFNILTPFPGTPLFDRLNKEERILTKDWSKYDLTQVVYKPKNMSPQDLQNGFYKAVESFHNYNNLLQRQLKTMKLGFNTSIGTFFQNIYELGVYKKILSQKSV